uniref:hypothetical protein n=1 Tax=uncultured Clostridium sp. TaxID=59620 RepID=UPI0026DA946E
MKKKEILVLIGEVLGSRAVYSIASLTVTITMLSGITIILRNDIRDIKNYVQSVVDGDPNYKEIHSQVSSSENVIRGNIDVESFLAKHEEKKEETTSTSNNISSGYDNYTPTQTVTDESNNKPSNGVNNLTGGGTIVADNNSNNGNSNNVTNNGNHSNNSDESKKEEILDRSSFNGKDIMISEGEPFNPMNGLQLAATDINGKNITNKIVIKENNVDTYKPGLYTVKATVELSDKSNLEKEFFVRVEPTVLNLAVNDMRASKDILEKSEEFNLSFAVKSSKSYLEVSSVNINNKDYSVKKTFSNSFLRKSNKYEVDLVAPVKSGTEKIQIKSVTMSDGTIVDVDKSIEIEILKEEAHIIDAVVKNITSEDEDMFLEYNLQDVDNVLNEAFLYLYDENDVLIQQEELEKNSKSSINLNINKNGKYKVKIKGYYKGDINTISDSYKEKELFSQNLEVNKFSNSNILEDEYDLALMSMEYAEDYNSMKSSFSDEQNGNFKPTLLGSEEKTHEISITGNIANITDEIAPSTISVTIPTMATFTVFKNKNVEAATINITSDSEQKVQVTAYKFADPTQDQITV